MQYLLVIRTTLAVGILTFLLLPKLDVQVFAQTTVPSPTVIVEDMSSGVGTTVTISDKDPLNGSIVSFSQSGYHLSQVPYDPTVYGVISDTTAVTLEDPTEGSEQSRVVISQGKALVRVTAGNGNIKAGNLITSSTTPGVGQLASDDGYVLGTALEDFTSSDPKKVGTVFVSLNLGFNSQSTVLRKNLFNNIKNSLTSPYLTPGNSLRYIIAGLAVLIGLGAGLLHFGRTTSNGIEALGRNPLARNAILLSMVVNLILTIIAMGIGLAIAYFILAL